MEFLTLAYATLREHTLMHQRLFSYMAFFLNCVPHLHEIHYIFVWICGTKINYELYAGDILARRSASSIIP
jgi:hypothetical protein